MVYTQSEIDFMYPTLNSKYTALRKKDKRDITILLSDNNRWIRQKAAQRCSAYKNLWDRVLKDDDMYVRQVLPRYCSGKEMDVLVKDKKAGVRAAVAKYTSRSKDLDRLVHDTSVTVLMEVARRGRDKDLDELVHHENSNIKKIVLHKKRPQDFDALVHDNNDSIRYIIAKQGDYRHCKILARDKNTDVSRAAQRRLNKIMKKKK